MRKPLRSERQICQRSLSGQNHRSARSGRPPLTRRTQEKTIKPYSPKDLFPYEAILDRPQIRWPNGAGLAVWVVVNIEHFHIDRFASAPDIRNYSRRDYGNRVGVWRLMDVLKKHGIRATVALNGDVVEHYPAVVTAATDLGWELMGHGMTNSITLSGLSQEEESEVIARTRRAIESCGQSMRGWLGPSLAETWTTPDALVREGVSYVADWINDDLPYRMHNGLYSIPYTIEVNDMPLFNNPSVSIEDFKRRIIDTFNVLHREASGNGRVMCIALHPFLSGVPHRIDYLDQALAHIASREDIWLATGSEIIDSYRLQTT